MIDDLIEHGATPDAESVLALTPASRRYVLARTNPVELSDADVAELRFTDERLRRALLRREPFTPGTRHDPALAALVTLASGGAFDEQLPTYRSPATAGREADLVALGAFLQRGDLDQLIPGLTADTSLWPLIAGRLGTTQLLDGLRGERADARLLGWAALTRAKERLYEADWAQAFDLARESLRAHPDVDAVAEAYNVMACACWQTGRDEAAQDALDQALGASASSSLQINLSIVTAELDPRRASSDLARLVSSAPSLELRSAAAMRAVSVWAPESLPWHDEPSGLPETLSIALRNLVNEAIDIDLFRSIVKMLSVTDPAWLARTGSLTGSPHGRSVEARLYRGAALGPLEYVSVLSEATRRTDPPEWVDAEIADAVRILRARYRRRAAPSPHPDDCILALAMIERGLEPTDSDVLVPLAVCGVCERVAPDGAAPDDWSAVHLADSEHLAHRAGRLADLRGLYQVAWNRLGEASAVYHRRRLLGAAEAFGRARPRLAKLPADRRDQAATTVLEPVLLRTDDATDTIAQLLPRVTDDGVREFMVQVGRSARALAADVDALIEPPDLTPAIPTPRRRRGERPGDADHPARTDLVLPGDPLLGAAWSDDPDDDVGRRRMSTSHARRNPYLVLGVDYAAPHEEVTAAYARRSRVARADSGYPYSIDDLVWALDEIERLNATTQVAGAAGIQGTAVTFRVPADPTAYEPPPGPGLLRPDPVPLRRRTRPAPRTEIAGLVTDARRDATAYALVQLAQQVERDLIAPAGRVRLSLPEPPRQPRSRGPWVALFAVLALAAVAVVLFAVGRGGDDVTEETTVAPTTTEFVVVTSPPAEGFQTPVESDGLTLTPTDPIVVRLHVHPLAARRRRPAGVRSVRDRVRGGRQRAARRPGGAQRSRSRFDRPGRDGRDRRDLLRDGRLGAGEHAGGVALHPAGRAGCDAVPLERRHAVTGDAPLP